MSTMRLLRQFVLVSVTAVTAINVSPATAQDKASCVQQMLRDAHYEIGKVDGKIGSKTRNAAAALLASYPQVDLPELVPDTFDEWCAAATTQPFLDVVADRAPLALVEWRDDQDGPKARWAANVGATKCQSDPLFRHGKFNPLPDKLLPAFDPSMVSSVAPIFPPAVGYSSCKAQAGFRRRVGPPPIVDAKITGDYFAGDYRKFESTYAFIGPAIATYRADPSDETAEPLKTFLVSWARANAISQNIHAPWGDKPVDYNVLKLVPPFIIGYSEVASRMTEEESGTVAMWLHRLVGQALASSWADRQDNKAYMRSNIAMLWGMLTHTDALKQAAYEAFDDALYDMRPDGSAPAESMRGGSGIHYSNRVATMLSFMAILGAADGQNLFTHEVEGRTLANVVNWAVALDKFPDLNSRYALPCPDAGDMPGAYDRGHPDLAHVQNGGLSSWAVGYLLSPDVPPETRELVKAVLKGDRIGAADIHAAGSLACYAAGIFGVSPAPMQ